MFYTNLSIFSLALLCVTCTPFAHAMDRETQNMSADMQSSIIDLLDNLGKTYDISTLHDSIKRITARNKDALNAKRTKDGETLLHTAFFGGYGVETIELLLNLGADATQTNNNGFTPLESACICLKPDNNRLSYIILLAKHECNSPAIVEKNKQKKGQNPLHLATENKNISDVAIFITILDHLINAGYSINAQNARGDIPVHYVLAKYRQSDKHLMAVLKTHKANFYIKNGDGLTPIEFAVKQRAANITNIVEKMTSSKPADE